MKKAKRILTDLVDKLKPAPPVLAPVDELPPPPPTPNVCPTLKEEIKPPVFILLGQYRELIQMLPAFKLIGERIGMKPIVIVSHQFAEVLDGVSYVDPRIVTVDFYGGMPYARIVAESICGAVTLQSWNQGVTVEQDRSGAIILQPFGMGWSIDISRMTSSIGQVMWMLAGLNTEDMVSARPVFDRRNPEREELLLKKVQQGNQQKKPLFLYNFTGVQTMFGYTPEVQQAIRHLNNNHCLVDLSKYSPERVFDWLGVFDVAAGMLTVDSYHIHLAAASNLPYLAFVEDGWNGSQCWGNCLFRCAYSTAKELLPQLRQVLDEKFQK